MVATVTRESLRNMLASEDKQYVIRVIGRALTALFRRQTQQEKASNTTQLHNTVGFSGADGRSGSLTAKYFIKHGTLVEWQVERWTKVGTNGYPRLCKYHSQLNEIAQARAHDRHPVEQQQLPFNQHAARAHMINAMQNEG